ncbi:HdeD family acid-resistance protein [Haloarchaeobius sp. TZWSO28]|uniref:HdeD family acid-resistance protein n=1 Tax=Haloarchaeobius sp. TZWSO28 TaxID=3446119 RepID=UPI003EBE3F51
MALTTAAAPEPASETSEDRRIRLAFGIIVVGLGVFVATMPTLAGGLIRLWLGVVLVAAGIALVADAKVADSLRTGLTTLGEAIGYMLVGIALMLVPLGQTRLATMFAILYGATGLLRVAGAVSKPAAARRESLLTGFLLLFVATLLVVQWPSGAVWALGLLYGAGITVVGLSMVVSALRETPTREPGEIPSEKHA